MRKKITMLLMSLLCCVGVVKAETGDVVDISNGYYTVQCNGNNKFANYNGGARIVPMDMGRFPTSTYLFTKGEDGAYTIQTSDKKFVTYKGTGTGDQLEIIEEFSANDNNKWWVVREGTSEGTITIVPKQENIGEKTPGWNYAVNFNGANGALGLWDCDDSNSQWLLKPAAVMAEGQAYIKCGGNYITFISEGENGEYLGKTQNKDEASIFTITPGNDGKYTIQLGEQFIVNNEGVKAVSEDDATDDNKWWVIAPNVTTEKSTGTEVDIIASQDNIGRNTNAWNFAVEIDGLGANSGLGYYDASDGGSKCEIEWIPITITYKYKFNDVEKYSETIEGCYIGHPYPAPTVELPFGVSMGNLPEGTITAENTTVDINLSVNLPFEYADKYESIDNWYYIQMHSSGGSYSRYIQAMADHIEWLDVDMDVAEADSYTWGFVGNPFDGFKLVNYANGNTKGVNANASANPVIEPAMGDLATATAWTIKPSRTNPAAEYFCFQYPGSNQYMNAQNGKIAYWSDADQGSTMWVTERDLSGVTELQALIESANAMVDALGESTGVGSVTRESLAELETKIEIAQAAADAKENCIAAQIELQAALDALVTIQPEIGKFYTIVSACSKNSDARNGQSVYVNAEGGLNFSNEGKVSKWFQFVSSDEPGKFYLYNVMSDKYLSSAKSHNGGQEEAKATSTDNAVKVTITNMGKDNIVKIVPEGGAMIHAQAGGNVVAWNNTAYDEASAWTLVEVENPGVAIVGDQNYATLAEAIEAVAENGVVKLIADVNASEIITIDKAITLDGNGKTLTSTAGRAINIETEGAVSISNLEIAAQERAINIINKAATVTVDKVTAVAKNNAVMIATSAGAVTLTVTECDFTGLAVINVAGAKAQVAIKNTTITNVDANDKENYGAITLSATAQGANVTVDNDCVITIKDDSKKAYVFPGDATVEGVDQVGYVKATIGDAGFETLEGAIEYAKAGQTITLARDIEASEIITIDKAITLDGNGKTLTSTATGSNARAINVSGEAANGVTIKNLTIDAKGERAINIIKNATDVTIENVTATATHYTVNVAASAGAAKVTIANSNLTGLNVVNVSAAGAQVTVDNSIVNCNDNNTTAGESYAALCLNKDAVGGSIVATNTTVNVTDDSDSMKGRNGAEDGTVTINGSTEGVAVMVAVITYEGSDYYYSFTTLEKAIEFAKAGDVVTLIRSIEVSEIITIDKAITLDGNGKTLKATGCEFPIVVSQSAEVNFVNCNLTYTREFAAVDTWYALYVPFAVELTDDFLSKYDVAEFSEMAPESMTITMVEEGILTANTPYFIRVKDEAPKTLKITVDGAELEFNASSTDLGDEATLNGVYSETEASSISGAYALSGGVFRRAEKENQVLKPFRFYLMFNEPSVSESRIITISVEGEDGATSIDSELMSPVNGVIYDLQGRRVENPTKGLYIVNGKKVMIK